MEDTKKFDKFTYNNAYTKNHYDRIVILVPKGRRDILKQNAKSKGVTMNQYINSAIEFYETGKGDSP